MFTISCIMQTPCIQFIVISIQYTENLSFQDGVKNEKLFTEAHDQRQ